MSGKATKTTAKKRPVSAHAKTGAGRTATKKPSAKRAAAKKPAPSRTASAGKPSTAAPAKSAARKPSRRTSRAPRPKGLEASYSGRIFRSRLEARWAILMDLMDINWDYEPCHYQVGPELFYLPDFYLPEYRIWLEVKGPAFLDAGSMAKCLAAVAGPMPLPLREAPYTPSDRLLLAGPLSRSAGRPVHTLISSAGPGRAELASAVLGRDGVSVVGGPWGESEATGIKKSRRPAPARIKLLLEPAPVAQPMDNATTAAYRFAARADFDDGTGKLSGRNDAAITTLLERRRAGRPLGMAA
ncbi:hypothetical protein [Arthrobacter sp. H14]|uniref:hypothetical protein n=1 Tax=Arthrobacter sp. H14 TaxID=1312959 RepID=UPI0012DF6BF6|nr:hypothetical protein [Arthrobacter sp. H14]